MEEIYRLIVDRTTVGIVVTQDGMLKFVNLAVISISGFSGEELTSQPFINFIHPDDQEMVMEHHLRRLKGAEIPETHTFRMIGKNGQTKWVENEGVVINWEGKPATLNFLSDITDRKRAEESLRESEEKYRQLFERESDAVMIFDAETLQFEDANRATLNLYGYSKKEFLSLTVEDISAEKEKSRAAVQKVKDGKLKSYQVSIRYFLKKNGTVFPGEIYAGNFYSKGRMKIIGAVRDITEHLRAQEALRLSKQRFKSIFENAPIGFYRTNPDGRILDANPALIKMLGYSSFEELAEINLERGDYHPEYPRRQFRERLERDGEIRGLESRWKKKDNTMVHVRENARAIRDSNETVAFYEGTVEDITKKKRDEDHIRSLSRQLIKAHENERQSISRELHDNVAQDLYTLKIACKTLFENHGRPPQAINEKMLELAGSLDRAIMAVRDLAYNLRPPALDDLGLVTALRIYCEEFAEKNHLKVDFKATGIKNITLNRNDEINLYRLVQEGLNNIRKHAQASHVAVYVVGSYPNVILRIEDDGIGFDMKELSRGKENIKKMGLLSMTERVGLLQGQITIQSRRSEGTQILVKIPYK